MEIIAQPWKGGLNVDDDLINLPVNDYEDAENIMLQQGSSSFEKIYGNGSEGTTPEDITGDCFGWFSFHDFSVLFIDNSDVHSIHLIYPDKTVEKILDDVKFDLDTSIHLVKCLLVNNEILVFTNGVDEIHKVNIPMAKMYVKFAEDTASFKTATVDVRDGNMALIVTSGTWEDGITKVFGGGNTSDTSTNRLNSQSEYNQWYGGIMDGYLYDTTTFVTNIPVASTFGTTNSGETFYILDQDIEEVPFAYRGVDKSQDALDADKKHKDFYLINTPHLDPPSVFWDPDSTFNGNNLRFSFWQFQVKYVYADESQSSWSPISKLLMDDAPEFNFNKNNRITVEAYHPAYYGCYDVEKIIFGVRKNEGDLYSFSEVLVESSFETEDSVVDQKISVSFSNKEGLIPIASSEAASQYDHIGKASDIELVKDNTIVLSNNQIGYTDVDFSGYISTRTQEIGESVTSDVYAFCYNINDDGTFRIKGTGPYSSGSSTGLKSISANTINSFGEIVDPVAITAAERSRIKTSTSEFSRNGLSSSTSKAFGFIEFGGTQVVGDVYTVTVRAHTSLPSRSLGLGLTTPADPSRVILSETADFECTGVTPANLITDIKAWYNALGLRNSSYGFASEPDTIEMQCHQNGGGDAFLDSGYWAPYSANSLQFWIGLQCPHDSPYHYSKFQIDYFTVTISRKTQNTFLEKNPKKQAEHPLAIRYRDEFGRTLQTSSLGVLDLTKSIKVDELNIPEIAINSRAPSSAVRYDVMYAGNKTHQSFIYARVATFVSVGTVSDDITIETYSDEAYTFTEGDSLRKVADYDGSVSYDYEDPSQWEQYRILSESSGTITVEDTADIAVGDVIVIYSQRRSFDDEDLLYYEVGETYRCLDGSHHGNVIDQDFTISSFQGMFNLSSASWLGGFANFSEVYSDTQSQNVIRMYVLQAYDYMAESIALSSSIEIKNGSLSGTYLIDKTATASTTQYDSNYDPVWTYLSGLPVVGFGYAYFDFMPSEEMTLGRIRAAYGETGRVIISPTTLHGSYDTGNEIAIDAIVSAQSRTELIQFGDTYISLRAITTSYGMYTESYSMLDGIDSSYWGKGRSGLIEEFEGVDFGGMVWYSEPYANNTTINGLSTVYSSSFEEYSASKGSILRMETRGRYLVMFKEGEVSRTLISKDEISAGSNNTLQSISGVVLSPNENAIESYDGGIGNAVYSIQNTEAGLYFGDSINKNYCFLVGDNVKEISSIKMDSYFYDLFSDPSNLPTIYSLFDRDTRSVVLHIKKGATNRQLIFSEERGRWISFWDVDCERLIYSSNLMSFEANKLYFHEEGADRLDINGSQVMAKIVKTFSSPDQRQLMWTNMLMDPQFADDDANKIEVSNEEGQVSELVSSDFSRDGAAYHAEFLRDENSPNMGSLSPLLEGDELQSKSITIETKSNSSDNTKLDRLGVKGITAENK